jgi:(p)ppGpp synthase/HD superfamily hydrolase
VRHAGPETTSFDAALILAAAVHQDQKRKGTEIPYITHPVQVARILERHGWPDEVVLAGLLHDVLEDLNPEDGLQRDRIRAVVPELRHLRERPGDVREAVAGYISSAFGERTLRLVEAVTERKKDQAGVERSWLDRKQEQLERFSREGRDVAALKAADLLHNAMSVTRDLEREGRGVWDRFRATPGQTLWYYRVASEIVQGRLGPDDPLGGALNQAIRALERAAQEAGDAGGLPAT